MDKIWYLVVFAIVIGGGYFAYQSYQKKVENDALQALYASVSSITSYVQEVETQFSVSDRLVSVRGTYNNNRAEGVYASFATTTLTVPDGTPYAFSLAHIVADETIYLKLERVSGDLPSTVPMGPTWQTFPTKAIPGEFRGVASPGPILDNLSLFRNDGRALTLLKSVKNDSAFDEPLTKFVYSMAPETSGEEPPVRAVRERLTGVGTVSMWTDPSVTSVRYLVFSAPNYSSTTTIESVNIPVPVSLPE